VIIEVPRAQRNKLEYDKETDTLQLDRVLHSSCHYPGDYGFVPRTLCPDGDPIDVLVLSKFALAPGVVVDCRLVGVMDMEDEKGGDAKLIAVVASEPRTTGISDIENVPAHVKVHLSSGSHPSSTRGARFSTLGDLCVPESCNRTRLGRLGRRMREIGCERKHRHGRVQ
jgi:hypothetical protein